MIAAGAYDATVQEKAHALSENKLLLTNAQEQAAGLRQKLLEAQLDCGTKQQKLEVRSMLKDF